MTVLVALAAAARNTPWQAWAVLGLLLAGGIYGCQQRREGAAGALVEIERKQQEQADAARKEVDRLRGGADRSRVQQFDRD
ncbi:hypothetical protein ASE61_00650 [Bosea sp. Root670]|uniref:hypothetical protein n=1 Tax=Bosea sp. Root670 TaxID=1736583 RepID=UPI0007126609|nr:hypothetical protein [Bosea sp. Root670]KRE08160.1 hypothetical protein ASE61_00650 [Bosea sp. Root670]